MKYWLDGGVWSGIQHNSDTSKYWLDGILYTDYYPSSFKSQVIWFM